MSKESGHTEQTAAMAGAIEQARRQGRIEGWGEAMTVIEALSIMLDDAEQTGAAKQIRTARGLLADELLRRFGEDAREELQLRGFQPPGAG